MNALLLLALCTCAWAQLCREPCGQPSDKHPPFVRIKDGKIDGIRRRRISRGIEANPHSFPWMVWISNTGCGGSVINRQWVLTAAHCVVDNKVKVLPYITMKIGAHDRLKSGMQVTSRDIRVHSKYTTDINGVALDNDIALIKLPHPLTYSDTVQPICLPDSSDKFTYNDGTKFIVAGWGSMVTGRLSHVLMMALMHTTYTHATCKKKINLGHMNPATEFCGMGLGTAYEGTCKGDSGGPQMVYKNGRYVQIGLTTRVHNVPCGKNTEVSTFTHIPTHISWIKQITNIGSTKCCDKEEQCAQWVKVGYCTEYPRWMDRMCQKSCAKCQEGGKCHDKNNRCPHWASKGECSKNPMYMCKNCAKSCGKCGGGKCYSKSELCAFWALKGECSKNPQYMCRECAKSCGKCREVDKCHDKSKHCVFWTSKGRCFTNPQHMRENCAKSCGKCGRG